jgi:hypothetical protein
MLRRPQLSKIEVVVPKEEEDDGQKSGPVNVMA